MVVLVLLLEDRVKVPQVQSVLGVVVGWHIHTNTDLVVNVLVDVVLLVEVLFFFLEDFEECLSFGFRRGVKVEVIEDELTFVIDIVNNLHESDCSLILRLFYPGPYYAVIWIDQF